MTLRARIEALEMRKKASPDDENSPALRLIREIAGARRMPAERLPDSDEYMPHVMELIRQLRRPSPRVHSGPPK